MHHVLKVHPNDNVVVALRDLAAGELVNWAGEPFTILEKVPSKHKFAAQDLASGDPVYMYGVLVGRAKGPIFRGAWIHTGNLAHATQAPTPKKQALQWVPPPLDGFAAKTFLGYHRPDGKVGTANYWLVIPLVFCENRNLEVLREALLEDLGYGRPRRFQPQLQKLVSLARAGKSAAEILALDLEPLAFPAEHNERLFPQVDGIKFLIHDGGCGGTRQDAQTLCGLLAGYLVHPNVAGATILSLGCQNAQMSMLQAEIVQRDPALAKPLYWLEQQSIGTEAKLLQEAIKCTFAGLVQANAIQRQPAPLSKLCLGLECGGSDGFSGISANPAVGYAADLLVGLGGSVILAEFPELCGVEQELCDRCLEPATADRFTALMEAYQARAVAVGSGFDMNPSPGNIKDGLITDAMKSAGAAKKGGTAPIRSVLDYPEMVTQPGLHLLCTPGNDVESTTAEVGAGANLVLFTTGLGTPTGNPIAPVVKISSNTALAQRMPDIIDFDAGSIIAGKETIPEAGERLLDYVIQVASGNITVAAVRHGQDDFIPWKRGVSL